MNAPAQTTLTGGLEPITPDGRRMSERQEAVWRLVCETEGGVTAEEVGAFLHARKGVHSGDVFCRFCFQEGHGVLRSKALRPRVVRRRISGRWEPRNPAERVSESAQLRDLPGESFEDIFA